MRKANLSILGLYNYDPTIFDGMLLPTAVEKVDVVNNIVLECAEMEAVYPSADFIKTAIGIWSKTNLPVWEKLEETLHYEYDPIANYDRTEEWEDVDNATIDVTDNVNSTSTESGENSITSSGKTNVTSSGTSSRDVTINTTKNNENSTNENGTSESDNTESVAGYNSENLVVSQKAVANGKSNLNKTSTDNGEENTVNNEETSTDGSQETTNNDTVSGSTDREIESSVNGTNKTVNNRTTKHRARMFGNIGVTTTQEMIEAQRKVVEFNLISRITEDFKQRFCILVY